MTQRGDLPMTNTARLCAEIARHLARHDKDCPGFTPELGCWCRDIPLLRSALAALQAITAERDAAQQLMAEEWPRMVQRAEQAEAALKSHPSLEGWPQCCFLPGLSVDLIQRSGRWADSVSRQNGEIKQMMKFKSGAAMSDIYAAIVDQSITEIAQEDTEEVTQGLKDLKAFVSCGGDLETERFAAIMLVVAQWVAVDPRLMKTFRTAMRIRAMKELAGDGVLELEYATPPFIPPQAPGQH